MRPRHTAAHPQVFVVLVADVEGGCFRVTLAVAIAPTTSATTREVAVVHVVGIAHESITHRTKRLHRRQANAIAMVGTVAHVRIHLQAVAGTSLRHKLQHEVVVAVIDTRQSR